MTSRTSPKMNQETLQDALDDLENIEAYASETGCPAPDEATVSTARKLLLWMHELAPRYYGAGPDTGGGIAIDAQDRHGTTISVIVEPGGNIAVVKFPNDGQALRRFDCLDDQACIEISQHLLKLDPRKE